MEWMVIRSFYIQAASAINNSRSMFFYSIHNVGLRIKIIYSKANKQHHRGCRTVTKSWNPKSKLKQSKNPKVKTTKRQQAKENTKAIQTTKGKPEHQKE